VQLQNSTERFEKQGIKVAAISYDSSAILMDFANRHHIQFPLLADADSKVIGSFNVLNAEAKGMTKGMAHPGFFYIDENGVIREKVLRSQIYRPLHPEQCHWQAFSGIGAGGE